MSVCGGLVEKHQSAAELLLHQLEFFAPAPYERNHDQNVAVFQAAHFLCLNFQFNHLAFSCYIRAVLGRNRATLFHSKPSRSLEKSSFEVVYICTSEICSQHEKNAVEVVFICTGEAILHKIAVILGCLQL